MGYNNNMESLCDFPATIVRIKTLVDGGIRIEFDLPETQGVALSTMHGLRDRYLHIVIYDDNEFQLALLKTGK